MGLLDGAKKAWPVVLLALLAAAALAFAHLTPAPKSFRQLSAEGGTVCAIRQDTALFCWGDNRDGQVGTGEKSDKEIHPIQILDGGVTDVDVGETHVCAIRNGSLWCWGENFAQSIFAAPTSPADDATGTPAAFAPKQVIAAGVTGVAAGAMQTCAIVKEALQCWGDGKTGMRQLFDSGVTAVTAKFYNTCAIVKGALWCWGRNTDGQVGNGEAGQPVDTPTKVISQGVTAVAVGGNYTCAVVNQALECWGAVAGGRLGQEGTGERVLHPKTIIADGVAALDTGTEHACVVTLSGQLQCWGYSSSGDIQDNGNEILLPTPVTLVHKGVTAVATGNGFTCAIIQRALRCRGYDGYGSPLTAQGGSHEDFSDSSDDVLELNQQDHLDALEVASLPVKAAGYLQDQVITDGKTIYLTTRVKGSMDVAQLVWRKSGKGLREEHGTHLRFDVVELFPLSAPEQRNDQVATTTLASIPSQAACRQADDLDGNQELRDPHFAVLKRGQFVSLRTAGDGRFDRLPTYHGWAWSGVLQLREADLKKLQACVDDTRHRLAMQPLKSITVNTNLADEKVIHIPATLEDTSIVLPDSDEQGGSHLTSIEIEPKTGKADAYQISSQIESSLQCADVVLRDWKHGYSSTWPLDFGLGVFSTTTRFDLVHPDFPRYTPAELQAALRQAQQGEGKAGSADAAACTQVLTAEIYTIQKAGKPIKSIYAYYRSIRPLAPLNCDAEYGKPATLAVHVADRLGYPVIGEGDQALCEAMPGDSGTTIVALSYQQPGSGYAGDNRSGDYDLDVLLVDTHTQAIQARWQKKSANTSDSYVFGGIRIDTGDYWLNKTTRAFGVQASHYLPSHVATGEDTKLNLYVRQDNKLHAVLESFETESMGESDKDDCFGVGTTHNVLQMGDSYHHGMRDLVVKSSTTIEPGDDGSRHCAGRTFSHQSLLRYDGEHY